MNKIVLFFSLIIIFFTNCKTVDHKGGDDSSIANNQEVKNFTDETFHEAIEKSYEIPVVIGFLKMGWEDDKLEGLTILLTIFNEVIKELANKVMVGIIDLKKYPSVNPDCAHSSYPPIYIYYKGELISLLHYTDYLTFASSKEVIRAVKQASKVIPINWSSIKKGDVFHCNRERKCEEYLHITASYSDKWDAKVERKHCRYPSYAIAPPIEINRCHLIGCNLTEKSNAPSQP